MKNSNERDESKPLYVASVGRRFAHVYKGEIVAYRNKPLLVKPVKVERQRLLIERTTSNASEFGKFGKAIKTLRANRFEAKFFDRLNRNLIPVNGQGLKTREQIEAFKAERRKEKRSKNKTERRHKRGLLNLKKG